MILISLGANLPSSFGSPRESLKQAIQAIAKTGIRVLYQSPIYLTAPVPISDQPWYHNAVIGVSTDQSPEALIKTLQKIENDFGRVRTVRNAPRVIDLDIIAYHDVVQTNDDLIIPHPRLHERAFVLYPLRDIDPEWTHPSLKKTVAQMISELPSGQDILKENYPLIMGIVNVTPDSFSDGGKFYSADNAIQHGLEMIKDGAHILDIGGESTRPNSDMISPEDEQRRILPVIEGLKNSGALLSIDTRNASTMRAALKAGAGMINDVSALTHDVESISILKDSDCRICLMHMQGTPQTMQINPTYKDVVQDVYDYLASRIDFCLKNGINSNRLIVDIGIGFGKTLNHNISLLQNMDKFAGLGVDVLLGTSRKSIIEKICEREIPPQQRLAGSLATLPAAIQTGCRIIRVHDVLETRQFLDVYKRICV